MPSAKEINDFAASLARGDFAERWRSATGRDMTFPEREQMVIAFQNGEGAIDSIFSEALVKARAEADPVFRAFIGQEESGGQQEPGDAAEADQAPAEGQEGGPIVDPGLAASEALLAAQEQALAAQGLDGAPTSGTAAQQALFGWMSPEQRASIGAGPLPGDEPVSAGTLAGMTFSVAGAERTRIAQRVQDGLRRSPKDVRNLQRNLVAAGYLSEESVRIPGWYDGATANALATAEIDASVRGVGVDSVLRKRILGNRLVTDKDQLKKLRIQERKESEHKRSLSEAYFQVWGESAPPGYIDQVMNLNVREMEFQETAKPAYLESPNGVQEQADLLGRLNDFMSGQGGGA